MGRSTLLSEKAPDAEPRAIINGNTKQGKWWWGRRVALRRDGGGELKGSVLGLDQLSWSERNQFGKIQTDMLLWPSR